jgi:hypothetical protein
MRFWKKFLIFAFLISICVSQVCLNEIGSVRVFLPWGEIALGLYEALAVLILSIFSWLALKSICSWCISMLTGNGISSETKIINSIAGLIAMDGDNFAKAIRKSNIGGRFKVIKTALLVNQGFFDNLDETGIPQLDILIIKSRLKNLIKNSDIVKAASLLKKTIMKHYRLLSFIQDEILEVVKIARLNKLSICFDPRKFKYCLPASFADKYFASLAIVDIDEEMDDVKRLKALEKAFKNYPADRGVTSRLLSMVSRRESDESGHRKTIDIMKRAFQASPDRNLAYPLVQSCKNDSFEVARKIAADIPDTNSEKLWFFLIIATKLNIIGKAKEILKQ